MHDENGRGDVVHFATPSDGQKGGRRGWWCGSLWTKEGEREVSHFYLCKQLDSSPRFFAGIIEYLKIYSAVVQQQTFSTEVPSTAECNASWIETHCYFVE